MEPALRDDFQFNVLIVDDDASILSLMKEILSMVPGCNILTAAHPSEGMKEIIKGNVDILFTDIHMPGHSGLEFLQDIVALDHSPEVIVMSGFPTPENANAAMELGALSFISKPFEDISVVEVELEKAIKRIIRQRAAEKATELKKIEVSKADPKPASPVSSLNLDVSIHPAETGGWSEHTQIDPSIKRTSPAPAAVEPETAIHARKPANAAPEVYDRKLYDGKILEPLIEIEIERFKRYSKQFCVGFIDLPEDYEARTEEARNQSRKQQMINLEKAIRRSDVLLDMGAEGVAVLGFECNKVGSEVMEHKLRSKGFEFSGFAIHPADGITPAELLEKSRARLQTKRKLQILIYEQEEFFGRIVQNMLADPKYHITWTRTLDETYKTVNDQSETLKLFILSLSKEKEQWKVMANMLQEGLIRWPILLFVDVVLTKEVKMKLSKLGVRAIVNKSTSQEEFMYLVQSFVMPKPVGKERKNYRALSALPVTFRRDGKAVTSNTFTLSRDGLFIRDMNPPSSGEVVDLEMYMPNGGGVLKTRIEVLYAVPYFVGVNRFHVPGFAAKFIDLTPDKRDQLEDVVANSLTSYLL